MLCVIDHKSPCVPACPFHYSQGGCFWEDARRASKSYYRICPKCGAHLDPRRSMRLHEKSRFKCCQHPKRPQKLITLTKYQKRRRLSMDLKVSDALMEIGLKV